MIKTTNFIIFLFAMNLMIACGASDLKIAEQVIANFLSALENDKSRAKAFIKSEDNQHIINIINQLSTEIKQQQGINHYKLITYEYPFDADRNINHNKLLIVVEIIFHNQTSVFKEITLEKDQKWLLVNIN